MGTEDFMADRRKGLEDAFFARRNAELPENLRRNLNSQEEKQALAAASGISDETVLNHLLQANIHAETIAAIGVIPLLAVAWADGDLDVQEKEAVLSACETEGIATDSECYRLLESWLQQPPSQELLNAWKDFMTTAKAKLSPEALSALKDDVLGRASKIAQTSGGILGINSISSEENRVLSELRRALEH